MRLQHFGDSYDIVKKCLLNWLSPFGPWVAHPMLTETFADKDAEGFAKFLGVPLVSTEVLHSQTDRSQYFSCCLREESLFLDPDTDVRIAAKGKKKQAYIFSEEIRNLCEPRKNRLVMSFDQSLAHGSDDAIIETVKEKLQVLERFGLSTFAYVSHVAFIVATASPSIADDARKTLISASFLPKRRVVSLRD